MTNAEKYKEVFGFDVEKQMCPTDNCLNCPTSCSRCQEWWNSEYKGVQTNGIPRLAKKRHEV